MFCTKCGAKLEAHQNFCCFCGQAVHSQTTCEQAPNTAQDTNLQDELSAFFNTDDNDGYFTPVSSNSKSGATNGDDRPHLFTAHCLEILNSAKPAKKNSGWAITSLIIGLVCVALGIFVNSLLLQIPLLIASGFGLIVGILCLSNKHQFDISIAGTALNLVAMVEYCVIILSHFFTGIAH